MSNIRDNLLRIHLARNVADIICKNSTDLRIRSLARRLKTECDWATRSLEWNSVKINLRTVDRIMKQYSTGAYGNPEINRVDVLRLIGVALAGLDDAAKANDRPEKRRLIETCLDTLVEINGLLDGDLAAIDAHMESVADAGVLETVLEAA